ncbi:MAG: iron dicitrate transport regulator FecR [Rhodospirillales bacterium]|nr:iron dicitrate transport regulator FecR [Rhodospirillales bacterium]
MSRDDLQLDDDLATAASRWRLRSQSVEWTVSDEHALQDWLTADPAHARAFDQSGAAWSLVDTHAVTPEMMALRRDALERARSAASRRWSAGGRGRTGFAIAASVALLLVVGGMAAVVPPGVLDGSEVYETGVGERRVVTLQDGSRVSLDAETKVQVRYTEQQRNLTLSHGQARFDVTRDPARPFGVRMRDQIVVATGTSFNIDLLEQEAFVTLIEGHVVLLPATGGGPAEERKELQAGEQLVVAPDKPAVLVPKVDLDRATAWQRGKLVFNDERLPDVLLRVNRYAKTRVELGDAEVQRVRVSGVFDAGDVAAFVEGVTSALPVSATRDGGKIVLRSRVRS